MNFLKISLVLFFTSSPFALAMESFIENDKENIPVYSNIQPKNNKKRIFLQQNLQKEKKQKAPQLKRLKKILESTKKKDLQLNEAKESKKNLIDRKNDLPQKLQAISEQIENAHKEANWGAIYRSFNDFHKLDHKESEWQSLANKLKAYKWPSQQTWKEVIGGHLFFPPKTIEWEAVDFESYHLRRIDILWSFAVGAKYKHALSKFYLVRMLDKIRSDYTDAELPSFFVRLYTEAFGDLKQCGDNSDACYVIGRNYSAYPYLSHQYLKNEQNEVDIDESAIKWHEEGRDLKNQCAILEIKEACTAIYSSPSAEDYLFLAKEGYYPAYGRALSLIKEDKENNKIRKEALEKGYMFPLIGLASYYEEEGNIKKVREYYLKAGQAGVSYGYLCLGQTYVGDVRFQFKKDRVGLKTLSRSEIDEAIKAFTLAGESKDPGGWEYLSALYQELYEENIIKTKEYREKIVNSLQEGARLGSANCYHKSSSYLPKQIFKFFVENFGNPPQMEFRYTIENFLDKKY